MTILLTQEIRIGGVRQSAGTQLSLEAGLEGELVTRNVAIKLESYSGITGADTMRHALEHAAMGLPGLLPSGGDDGPAMAAMCAKYGVVNLGPGTFKVNSYTALVSPRVHGKTGTWMAPVIIGQGLGVTIIDTSGFNSPSYSSLQVTSFSAAYTPAVVLNAGEAARVGLANLDELRAEVYSGSIQANQMTWRVSALSGDTFTATPLEWGMGTNGTTAWTTSPTNFLKYYLASSQPVFQVMPPISAGSARYSQINNFRCEGVSFVGLSDWSGATPKTQRLFALQTDEGGVQIRIVHGAVFRDVQAIGYECVVHAENVTNLSFEDCDLKGNGAVVWAGYNHDICTFYQCYIGNDAAMTGEAFGAGVVDCPKAFAKGYLAGINNFKADSCWVLGAEVLMCADNAGGITIKNCYFEQARKIVGKANGSAVAIEGNHFSSWSDTGFTVQPIMAIQNAVKQRITVRENNGGSNAGPYVGYIDVSLNATSYERFWPMIYWENNRLGYLAGKGQLHAGSTYISLIDDHDPSGGTYPDQNLGAGLFYFESVVQTGGSARTQSLTSAAGAITPNFLNGTRCIVPALQEATTIGALTNTPTLSAALALKRMLPLTFEIVQDGIGGHAVTWNVIFKFESTFSNAGNTAGTKTYVTFRWDGAAWRQTSPQNVWL